MDRNQPSPSPKPVGMAWKHHDDAAVDLLQRFNEQREAHLHEFLEGAAFEIV